MIDCLTAAVAADGSLEAGSADDIVAWWSVTKTLIAAAALRLAEEGRLALDAPLDGHAFTPRQLLQHRAGVGDYGGLRDYHDAVAGGYEPWSEDALLARVPPDRPLFAPDTGWAYSNVGYLLLRRAIEARHGTGLAAALRELVLAPLGLRSTRLAETRADMDATAFAGGHGYHPGWVFHGVAIGPVSEAALALHRIACGDLLAPASRAAMRERHPIGGPIPGRPWVRTGYGLGLMTGTMRCEGMAEPMQVLGHSAGGPGSVGAVYHAPDTGCTVAAFADGGDEGVTEHAALRRLAGLQPPSPP